MSDPKASITMSDIELEKSSAIHVEHGSLSTTSSNANTTPKSTLSAKQQYQQLWTAIKADSRYCWWALYCMLLVFGWGYDAGLSGVAIAFPKFREVYGNYYAPTPQSAQYVIPALWQSLWNAASTIGQVFGGYAAGQFADMVGRKALLYTAVVLSLSASFALVFAPNLPVLFVSKLLLGLAVGLSTATPPLYVTENAPAHLRSTFSSLTNVVIVLGYFCSSLTGYGSQKIQGVWSFKLAFVMTFVVPALYLIGLPFFPESPVYLIKKGREEQARKSVLKLYGQSADVEGILTTIKKELHEEEASSSGVSQTSWKAIFSKEHRARTFVAVLGLQSQNFSGGCESVKKYGLSSRLGLTESQISPAPIKPTTSNSSASRIPSS